MDQFTIKRNYYTLWGVFGFMADKHGFPVCLTAERPDLGNQKSISCIPAGTYTCHKHVSPSKGECISIKDVEGRTDVLIHKGNYPMIDSEGCILVGEKIGRHKGMPVVWASGDAMNHLMSIADKEFTLIIEDVS